MCDEPEPIEIPLGNTDLFAWIDKEDEEIVSMGWSAQNAGSKEFPHYYAVHKWRAGSSRGEYYLHNEIWERMMKTPVPRGFLVDHINGDKLDNRRSNLRLATRMQNEANKRKRRTQKNQKGGQPTSKYKGVCKLKNRKKCWRANLTYEGRQINLGSYYSEKEAAEAYNKSALKYFGEFALLNEIEDNDK